MKTTLYCVTNGVLWLLDDNTLGHLHAGASPPPAYFEARSGAETAIGLLGLADCHVTPMEIEA